MGSIPLPALGVKVPEQPNALETLRGIQQIQAGQQEAQARKIQIQNAQMQQQDQIKLRDLYVKHGGDLDKVLQDAPTAGVSPQTIQQLQLHSIDAKTKTAELVAKQGANAVQQADLMQGAHDAVDKASADQKPAIYQQQLEQLKKMGIDTSQMPPQYPGDEPFKLVGAMVKGHKQQVADAFKEREVQAQEMQARARMATAEKDKIPGVDQQELSDFIAHPPKGYRGTPTDFARWKATLAPVAQINVANAAGGGMSDAATDQAAERYHLTGQLPPGNRGVAGLAQNRKIMNRAAELFPGSMTTDSAEYKANTESLKGLQKNLDAVSAFENTAIKNIDLLLEQGKKVIDSGSPWVNRPLRTVAQSGMGSADLAAFNAARQVAINEIAKVTSSPWLTGQLSDTARREVEAFIPANATLAQTMRVAQVLKQDMANRHQSYQEQIDSIKKRMPGKKPDEGSKKADPLGIL